MCGEATYRKKTQRNGFSKKFPVGSHKLGTYVVLQWLELTKIMLLIHPTAEIRVKSPEFWGYMT